MLPPLLVDGRITGYWRATGSARRRPLEVVWFAGTRRPRKAELEEPVVQRVVEDLLRRLAGVGRDQSEHRVAGVAQVVGLQLVGVELLLLGLPLAADALHRPGDVRPLPPDAPKSFYEGNVGSWTFRVTADESATRVGSAVRITLAVSGDGQLGRLEVPTLPDISGARMSEPDEETQTRVRNLIVGGTKKAVYSLTPLREGTLRVPPT